MNDIVLAWVLVYMIGMLAIGYWSSKKVKNLADFLVAGRRLPFFLAVATLLATWFGAGSCMGASGTAYSKGLLGVISDPYAAGMSLILAGFFYVSFLRRLELLTVTDIFARYYSKNSEIFASLLMVPVYIGWLGSQMVALGFIMNTLTGIEPLIGIIFGAFIVILYTFGGGMWAVTLTDFIQVIILALGLLVLSPYVIGHIGGFDVFIKSTPREYWHIFPKESGYSGWISYIGRWALMGLGCIVGQDLIQRSLASRTEKVARYSAITAGGCYMLLGSVSVLIGLGGRIIMPDLEYPEHIMPNLAMSFLPPFMLIIFLGALVSAIMSSADSSLLAATSLTINNIILKLLPNIKERNILPLARMTTIIIALISMFVALYVKQIYNLMVNSWATLFVGIFIPVTAALYWRKANCLAAWCAMISGTATWLGYIIVKTGGFQEVSDSIFYSAATYGGAMSFLSYIITTLFRYRKIKFIKLPSEYPAK